MTSLEVFHSQRSTDSSYMGSTLGSTCDQTMRLTFLLSLPKPALLLKDLQSTGFNNMRSHKTLHQIKGPSLQQSCIRQWVYNCGIHCTYHILHNPEALAFQSRRMASERCSWRSSTSTSHVVS